MNDFGFSREEDVDVERLKRILAGLIEAATEEKLKVADNHDSLMHENTQYAMVKRLEEILTEAKNLLGEFSLLHTQKEYPIAILVREGTGDDDDDEWEFY